MSKLTRPPEYSDQIVKIARPSVLTERDSRGKHQIDREVQTWGLLSEMIPEASQHFAEVIHSGMYYLVMEQADCMAINDDNGRQDVNNLISELYEDYEIEMKVDITGFGYFDGRLKVTDYGEGISTSEFDTTS